MKDQTPKIEYMEKEIANMNLKLAKRKNKIRNFKQILEDFQNQLEKNKMELIEIEEKNINLAEFIKKEIQYKSVALDPSPTFKDNSLVFAKEDFKTSNKNYEQFRFSDIPIKDSSNNFKAEINNNNSLYFEQSPILEGKSKFKKYGRDAQAQVIKTQTIIN